MLNGQSGGEVTLIDNYMFVVVVCLINKCKIQCIYKRIKGRDEGWMNKRSNQEREAIEWSNINNSQLKHKVIEKEKGKVWCGVMIKGDKNVNESKAIDRWINLETDLWKTFRKAGKFRKSTPITMKIVVL